MSGPRDMVMMYRRLSLERLFFIEVQHLALDLLQAVKSQL